MRLRWDWIGLALGVLGNLGVQWAWFRNGQFGSRGGGASDFLAEFSWLMLGASGFFGWIIGYLYDIKAEQRWREGEIGRELDRRRGERKIGP